MECVICYEPFGQLQGDISALKCGHVYHRTCVQRWITNSPACPSCRKPCYSTEIIQKLFLDFQPRDDRAVSPLTAEVTSLKAKVAELEESKRRELSELENRLDEVIMSTSKQVEELTTAKRELETSKAIEVSRLEKEVADKKNEIVKLKNMLSELKKRLDEVIMSTSKQVEELATAKRELEESKSKLEKQVGQLSTENWEREMSRTFEIFDLEKEIAYKNREIVKLKNMLSELKKRLDEFIMSNPEKVEQLTTVNSKLEESKSKLEKQVEELSTENWELEMSKTFEIFDLEEEIADQNGKIMELMKVNSDLDKTLDNQLREQSEMKHQLKNLDKMFYV